MCAPSTLFIPSNASTASTLFPVKMVNKRERAYSMNVRFKYSAILALSWCSIFPACAQQNRTPAMRAIIVGGGPSAKYDQAAIESNVRYVQSLLPAGSLFATLFTDGDKKAATVLFSDTTPIPVELQLLDLIMDNEEEESAFHYRTPHLLSGPDGPAALSAINSTVNRLDDVYLQEKSPVPLLLYFTGHGSPDRPDYKNNQFDLWQEGPNLTVNQLRKVFQTIPNNVPITLVMVQCFSGAFADLLFDGSGANKTVISRDFAGFFASLPDHVAAGCTSAVDESNYHDFTSYFFAALSRHDRIGRQVSGADYNHDGKVDMEEAFCYTLIHDDSIDTPVCTSDLFLRKYVTVPDAQIIRNPWKDVISWVDPAQKAALIDLSSQLNLTGDDRASKVYDKLTTEPSRKNITDIWNLKSRLKGMIGNCKELLIRRFPELVSKGSDIGPSPVRYSAVKWLSNKTASSPWKDLIITEKKLDQIEYSQEHTMIHQARLIRFMRLFKTVVLTHKLFESADAELKSRFIKLREEERRVLPLSYSPSSVSQNNWK